MQEFTDIDLVNLIPIFISSISLLVSAIALAISLKKERTRQDERMIEALSKCYTLLEEAIRMHPDLNTTLAFVFPKGFADKIYRKADDLNGLSWACKHLGEDIREAASILKSMVRVEYAASDDYLSNEERRRLLADLATIRDAIAEYLKELHQ
jgi:hypothetical protein